MMSPSEDNIRLRLIVLIIVVAAIFVALWGGYLGEPTSAICTSS